MCGIAGIVNYQDADLFQFMSSLKHRGPDDGNIYKTQDVALVHTRLSIQDVKNGVQPFHYGNYSIVFNGEIYNHLELRKKLHDFSFQTNSDTETLLYLFIKYNYQMFDMLDGMYAFCIYDKNNNKLILARDRSGKKPLYYYKDNHNFIFASELNTIKTVKKLNIDPDSINCYLRAGYVWTPNTTYEKVLKLEAASYLTLDIQHLKYETHRHFNILDHYQDKTKQNWNFQNNIDELESRLERSIFDRITASDVEVGVFLSGGIDSNLIAAFASKIKPNLKTFTVKFEGLYDESSLAKLTANKYNTNHIELSINSDLNKDIEKILLAYGEPFMDSSAIPSYYVSREASKHVKVVLGGDGADELFAGYRRYVPAASDMSQFFKFVSPFLDYFPKPRTKQSLYNYMYRMIAISNKTGLDYYLSATSDLCEDVIEIKKSKITESLGNFVVGVFNNRALTELKKMLYTDFSVLLFCDLLVKMDIASMANSLEVRSPFLSKYMLEFAPTIPDKYKINKFRTKFILRKLAEKYLPTQLINQPKRGFEVPLKKWVDYDLRDAIHDSLKAGCYSENYIERKFIQQLLINKIHISTEKRAKILWSLYCLEVWHRNETKNYIYR